MALSEQSILRFAATIFILILAPGYLQSAPVQRPALVRHIKWTGTAWFGSPMVHDLGSGSNKIIGTFYSIIVWGGDGAELDRVDLGSRVYAPAVVADLEGDGVYEIVAGSGDEVVAYEWRSNRLIQKNGWPASVCSGGQCPEVRGLAAGDLDMDGSVEIVATTTQTEPVGAQVFVFSPNGDLYQPSGLGYQAWPRYNTAFGPGNDADANGPGNHGYGCYGLNVAIGNLDDDSQKEIVVTFDNHQINVFKHTGVSMLASSYYANRDASQLGNRLNWGQFIRWFNADVEHNHYHLHSGDWPHPSAHKWMQWTASPPGVADLNRDGRKRSDRGIQCGKRRTLRHQAPVHHGIGGFLRQRRSFRSTIAWMGRLAVVRLSSKSGYAQLVSAAKSPSSYHRQY